MNKWIPYKNEISKNLCKLFRFRLVCLGIKHWIVIVHLFVIHIYNVVQSNLKWSIHFQAKVKRGHLWINQNESIQQQQKRNRTVVGWFDRKRKENHIIVKVFCEFAVIFSIPVMVFCCWIMNLTSLKVISRHFCWKDFCNQRWHSSLLYFNDNNKQTRIIKPYALQKCFELKHFFLLIYIKVDGVLNVVKIAIVNHWWKKKTKIVINWITWILFLVYFVHFSSVHLFVIFNVAIEITCYIFFFCLPW